MGPSRNLKKVRKSKNGPSCPTALEPSCSEHSLKLGPHAQVVTSRHAHDPFEEDLPMYARICSSHPTVGPLTSDEGSKPLDAVH